MDASGTIQIIASLAEIVVAILAFLIATKKKKTYGWFMGITFSLLVVFNFARVFALEVPAEWDALVFLVACLSMVYAVWLIKEQ